MMKIIIILKGKISGILRIASMSLVHEVTPSSKQSLAVDRLFPVNRFLIATRIHPATINEPCLIDTKLENNK